MSQKKVFINIAPLVDVMLVLLIIFMITSPMMHTNIDLELPKTSNESTASPDIVTVSVARNGALYINDKIVDIKTLGSTLKQRVKPQDPLLFKADKNTPYDKVYEIINALVKAGYSKISLSAQTK
ncbi:MAG: biopolymer transporter ExbD [Alphaproteobacteria bacterium]|nr:MAG: biopolymer transporter ExbD [Alphaproteobacteria bacterium]